MDATIQSVLRLWEQEISRKEISRRLKISEQKVCKILVTVGAIETEEAKLLRTGLTVRQIAERLEKSEKRSSQGYITKRGSITRNIQQ